MSRHHIATHAYDFRRGWVRVPPTALTHEHASSLRDQGFTIVRSRRGWFGTRELPLSWYLRRVDADGSGHSRIPVSPAEQSAKLRERLDDTVDAEPAPDGSDPVRPSTRRIRQRTSGDE
ncbi:hypothetical protein [Microbacterium sp. RURRCA19A]|uniref:hypothetical protein n=1 Tax=Microbacterium sp. RURRCA19A TaxID=1907391 RepID=UPI0009570631|nr:hypothetical protein [Microbacterium sp. RURRCA19A]SIR56396.1 hypothetical protein SAMN05880568_0465 [Microbacterium sp. RURRCA19A]